jgi:hypothetical protein
MFLNSYESMPKKPGVRQFRILSVVTVVSGCAPSVSVTPPTPDAKCAAATADLCSQLTGCWWIEPHLEETEVNAYPSQCVEEDGVRDLCVGDVDCSSGLECIEYWHHTEEGGETTSAYFLHRCVDKAKN